MSARQLAPEVLAPALAALLALTQPAIDKAWAEAIYSFGFAQMMMDPHTTPDPGQSLLLTIDLQNDFTLPGAPACVPGTMEIVPNVVRVVEAFRACHRPIVHVMRLYRTDGANVDLCRRRLVEAGARIAAPGSEGAEIIGLIRPSSDARLDWERLAGGEFQQIGEREWLMYKPRWSAFFQTPLEKLVTDLGVNTVVLAGCNYPNCPRATLYDASCRDLRLVVVSDATSGLYDRAFREIEGIGAEIMSSSAVASWMTAEPASDTYA